MEKCLVHKYSFQEFMKINLFPRHLGYNLPMHHYLFVNSANKNEYTLKQYFGLVFEDLVAEDYELKVILPEGATEIKVNYIYYYLFEALNLIVLVAFRC